MPVWQRGKALPCLAEERELNSSSTHCRLMLVHNGSRMFLGKSKPKVEVFRGPYANVSVLPTCEDGKTSHTMSFSSKWYRLKVYFDFFFLGKTASPAETSNGRRQQSRIFFHSTEIQQWAAWSLLHTHTKHLPGKAHWHCSREVQNLMIKAKECVACWLSSWILPFI